MAVPLSPFRKFLTSSSQVGAAKKRHRFGCLMLVVPGVLSLKLREWVTKNVNPTHLYGQGIETEHHVTLKYGFPPDPSLPHALADVLKQHGPVKAMTAGLSLFPDSGDGVVLKLDVESEPLQELYHFISDNFPAQDKWYPKYKPHVTLAYLDPEFAHLYDGLHTPADYDLLLLDQAVYSSPDGAKARIRMPVRAADKTMSATDETSGGALVAPAGWGGPKPLYPGGTEFRKREVKRSPFFSKAIVRKKDKLGRALCYDDQTGKRVGCGGTKPTTEASGREKPAQKPEFSTEQAVGVLRYHMDKPATEEHLTGLTDLLSGMTDKEVRTLRDRFGLTKGGARGDKKAQRIASLVAAILKKNPPNKQGKPEKEPEDEPAGQPAAEPRVGQGTDAGSGTAGDEGAGAELPVPGQPLEGEAERPDTQVPDQAGEVPAVGPGDGTAQGVPRRTGTRKERVAASAAEVNRKIDRMEKLFKDKGNERAAGLLGMLKRHFNEVGVEAALASLGEEVQGEGEDEVGYTASEYWGESMGDFTQAYLSRYGIVPTGEMTVGKTAVAPGTDDWGDLNPVQPKETPYDTKLDEAKDLPGLEASEDLAVLMGGQEGGPTPHLTPEVFKKLDEKYGQNGWIIKTYGDDAFAGQGIFFPQRAAQMVQDAKSTMWNAGGELARYGFSHLRDKEGKVVGIKHENGDEYQFGTPKYENTIHGSVREWGDKSAAAAPHESGLEMPNEGKQYMVQPAFPVVGVSEEERAQGKTIVKGEGRVHVTVRNGKAEVIPHSTWLKGEGLPIVFENDETKAMAKAAQEAIDALPEKARSGQLYAPDVVKTKDGYKVVELNASVTDGGGSGYLQDNPFIIDAYVSHVTGREPGHVRFIRSLLTQRKKGDKMAKSLALLSLLYLQKRLSWR
jgi:hypothetical protein